MLAFATANIEQIYVLASEAYYASAQTGLRDEILASSGCLYTPFTSQPENPLG